MGFARTQGEGGFIISSSSGNYVGTKRVISREMLLEVAKLLGIPEAKREEVISGARSIHIYSGAEEKSGGGGR